MAALHEDDAIPTRVSIVGAGKIGHGLAELLHRGGIEVRLGSRSPHDTRFSGSRYPVVSLSEAFACPVVILAIPHTAIEQTLAEYRPEPDAIVLDTANALEFGAAAGGIRSALPMPHGRWLQQLLPEQHVVRAFSHVQDELLVSRATRQPGT